MKRFAMIVTLVAAAACGGKSKPATPPQPATIDDAVKQWVALAADAAQRMVDAPDCNAKTAAMKTWLAANKDKAHAAVEALLKYPEEQVQAKVEAEHKAHAELAAKMDAAEDACKDDEAFHDAWRDIGNAIEPPEHEGDEHPMHHDAPDGETPATP